MFRILCFFISVNSKSIFPDRMPDHSSWRLCSILGVSTERETLFYIVFTIFMFMAGVLLPLWNRYCLPKKASISASIIFALEISLFVWLPNVLIMAFFGTPFMLTIAYGIAYVFMIMICVLVYRSSISLTNM